MVGSDPMWDIQVVVTALGTNRAPTRGLGWCERLGSGGDMGIGGGLGQGGSLELKGGDGQPIKTDWVTDIDPCISM